MAANAMSRKLAGGSNLPMRGLRTSAIQFNGVPAKPETTRPVPVENDKPKSSEEPKSKGKKPKSWGFFKTAWRITYISALGGIAYCGVSIYKTRHPPDVQPKPDPSKKTLVILGSGWGSVSLLKKIDTSNYNVVVVSPRNFFLFTPLLPSCTTGTVEHRSIMEPIRSIIRNKQADVTYYEARATHIDYEKRTVTIRDTSNHDEGTSADDEKAAHKDLHFDYLVIGTGAQNQTFGIPGVQEYACFLKEIPDAQKIRKKIMDCIESASFKNLEDEERKRILHTVVVGGGPTGVEFAAELQDFFEEDLKKWVPGIAKDFKVTLVEALPNVLPSFSKQLIEYTERAFQQESISVMTQTMVKGVTKDTITAESTRPDGTKETFEMPYGLLVWATGNAVRPLILDLMASIPEQRGSRRGLQVNDFLVVNGTENVWALGDCTATKYAPTAQVAAQQGSYLGGLLNQIAKADSLKAEMNQLESKVSAAQQQGNETADTEALKRQLDITTRKYRRAKSPLPFAYSHQGSLAYVGMDQAVADLALWPESNFASGGRLTYWFWRSAYISMCFSMRNKVLVALDWLKVKVFGRDVSRE